MSDWDISTTSGPDYRALALTLAVRYHSERRASIATIKATATAFHKWLNEEHGK